MPFTDFKDAGQVIDAWSLTRRLKDLFPGLAPVMPDERLAKHIQFAQIRRKAAPSEMFFRERLISPLLVSVLIEYDMIDIWSNEYRIDIDAQLAGTPDYLLAALPERGVVPTNSARPLLAIAEAKREDYIGGWGQCLAEMIACQRLNHSPETPVWGIVTTGLNWEFGRLVDKEFSQHINTTDLDPLEKLLGILHFIFAECQAIAEKWAEEAASDNFSKN